MKFCVSSDSLVWAVNHMAARSFCCCCFFFLNLYIIQVQKEKENKNYIVLTTMAVLPRVCHLLISFPTDFLSNYFFLSFPRSQERYDNQDNRCSIFPSYLELVQTPRNYNRNFSCRFRHFRPPFASNRSCPFPEVET